MKYITPPHPGQVEWFSGPPPEVGWWPADYPPRETDMLRWWDGKQWSCANFAERSSPVFLKPAPMQSDIKWTARWWETK